MYNLTFVYIDLFNKTAPFDEFRLKNLLYNLYSENEPQKIL